MTVKLKPRFRIIWGIVLLLVSAAVVGTLTGCGNTPAIDSPRPENAATPTSADPAPGQVTTARPAVTPTSPSTPVATETLVPSPKTPGSPPSIEVLIPEISLRYIAPTEYEAMEVARSLDFVGKNYEDPSKVL